MAINKLSNLTERELLLLINEKVERLEAEMSAQQNIAAKIQSLELRVLEQEVKIRTWGTIIGFLGGIGGGLLTKLFNL